MSSRNSKLMNAGPGGLDRRSFLKLSALSTALPLTAPAQTGAAGGAQASRAEQSGAAQGELLPAIPKPADLASDRLVHHFRDLFNPPAAQNEAGYLQATKSVSGITAINYPPFGCCGVPEGPFSPGNLITCEIFLNGLILSSYLVPSPHRPRDRGSGSPNQNPDLPPLPTARRR